jgi:hypothetical protein
MKSISSFIICSILLFSCGKGRNTTLEVNPIAGTDYKKALEVQVPMSNDQLNKWIPKKIGEMEQRKILIGHKLGMGMSGAIATYRESGEAERLFSLEVLDGAGATGAVMLKSIIQKLEVDYEEKLVSGYSRIYEHGGLRVWEKLNDTDQNVEIEYVTGGRFHFIFKGHRLTMEELWDFVDETKREMS